MSTFRMDGGQMVQSRDTAPGRITHPQRPLPMGPPRATRGTGNTHVLHRVQSGWVVFLVGAAEIPFENETQIGQAAQMEPHPFSLGPASTTPSWAQK